MDHLDATVVRLLATQRHSEEIARGLASQRRAADLASRVPIRRPRRLAGLLTPFLARLAAFVPRPARHPGDLAG